MAKTLLNAVNEVLKRVGQIHGDDALLTTLTSTDRQRSIDIAIQVINEGVDELYTLSDQELPLDQAESTITLVAGDRDYALASDLVQLRWPMVDQTNNQLLHHYSGGYNQMIVDDPERDDTGLPHWGAIRPTDGELYLDRAPTSEEAGRVYTYQYDKELEMTTITDTVPFGNIVFRAMVPVWSQLWRREQENDFDSGLFGLNLGRAARLMSKEQPRDNYCPR